MAGLNLFAHELDLGGSGCAPLKMLSDPLHKLDYCIGNQARARALAAGRAGTGQAGRATAGRARSHDSLAWRRPVCCSCGARHPC